MKSNDFHHQVRVMYRACRRLYGTEKVQDECLRVFKVVFPFLHRARTGGVCGFDDKALLRIGKIFESWKPIKDSELDKFLISIINWMDGNIEEEEFVAFCEAITPVALRIRKLSPRECGRLMGCDEPTLDTMLGCGISKSSLYKLFGNSIVSGTGTKDSQGNYDGVLFNIFRKLFVETEPDVVKGEAMQLSLF